MSEQQNPPDATTDGRAASVEEAEALPAASGAAGPDAGSPSAEEPAAQVSSPRSTGFAVLALAVAFFAAAGTGFLWWQYRQFYLTLNEADSETAAAMERIRAGVRQLDDRVSGVAEAAAPMRAALESLQRRIDAMPGRFGELERRLNAVQGMSTDARTYWLTSEAEYYLALANTELGLAGHWENAVTALELADARLRELGNPAFGPVRALIAEELQALEAVRLPDVEGLSYSLGRLAERAPELPMRGDSPQRFTDRSGDATAAEPGIGRLWATLRAAVSSIVSIERRSEPVEQVLTDAERELTRRRFALELDVARLALLRGHADAFRESLDAATRLLERDFDAAAAPVQGAIELLAGMRELDVAPTAPDISGSLNALRRLTAGEI